MDHLTHPPNGIPLEDIPFFASSIALYDGLGFEDFPGRIRAAHGGAFSQFDQAWFIQGWLYFGLLREVFGQDLEVQDFIRPASPGRASVTGLVVSTAQLKEHMGRFDRRQASVLDVVFRAATSENCRVHRLLRFTIEECNRLDYKTGSYDVHLPAIMLSIQLLVQRLQQLGVGYLPRQHRRLDIPWQCPLSLETIRKHMVRQSNAWCPHQVQRLLETFSYQTLVYLAEMKRNVGPWFDHRRCFLETRCVGYNIDDKTFRGKHVDGCHGCSHVEAPLNDMYTILEDGGIPVLRCRRMATAPDDISLSYERLSSSSRYVAISHVWSDGLGTPSKNSVPRCQLNCLVDKVQRAVKYKVKRRWRGPSRAQIEDASSPTDDTLLWLDVYCVPASSRVERMVRLKRAAIDRMVPTYALARLTLVLDYELQNLKLTDRDPLNAAAEEEFLARVVISGWRTRCWTHQEHQVSRRVLFQCSGSFAAFDHNNVVHRGRPLTSLAYELSEVADRSLGIPSQTHFGISRFYRLGTKSYTIPKLGTAWDSFQGKSTSRPLDALYVFASVMRLSAKQIRDLGPENQIRAILRAAIDQEGGLPIGFFFSQAPRIMNSTEDCRDQWIPRFPGEGGLLDTGGKLAKSWPRGFILSMLSYHPDRGGCFGLKIKRPSTERFVVSYFDSQVEISLSLQGGRGLPLFQDSENTELLVVIQIPKPGDPFQGVGACFAPSPVSYFLIPWVVNKVYAEYVWCFPVIFRKLEDKVGIDGTSVEAVIVPYEREVREVAIVCGKCSARRRAVVAVSDLFSDWKSWEIPQRLVGRGDAGMRFWVWFGLTGVSFLPICLIPTMILAILISETSPTSSVVLSGLVILFHCNSFNWTASTLIRAEWLLLIQSYSADFDPKERWWRRLVKQMNTTPDLDRSDTFTLKLYAYWPWMLMLPWEWLWKLLAALRTVLRRSRGICSSMRALIFWIGDLRQNQYRRLFACPITRCRLHPILAMPK